MSEYQSSSNVGLAIGQETAFGVSPSALTTLRFTGESLKTGLSTKQSDEITGDGQVADLVRTNIAASGGVNFEMSFGSYDTLLKGALKSDWSTPVQLADCTAELDASENKLAKLGAFLTSWKVGSWIKLEGFTGDNVKLNTFARIASYSADELVLDHVANFPAAQVSGITATLLPQMTNGADLKHFTIQRAFTDIATDSYSKFTGMTIESMSLSFALEAMVTGSFEFIGQKEALETESMNVSAGTSTDVMNCVDGASIWEDGTESGYINSSTMTLTNNLRARNAIGQVGAISVGQGQLNVSGELSAYFTKR